MQRELALSIVIAGKLAGSLGSAVGGTLAQLGRIGSGLDAARRHSVSATQAVADLERTASKMQGFRALGREVLAASQAQRAAQEQVKALARELDASAAPTKAQQKALESARKEVERLAAAVEAKKSRFAAMGEELRRAGVDTRNLSDAQRKLAGELSAAKGKADAAAVSMRRLEEGLGRSERASASFQKHLVGIGALGAAMTPFIGKASQMQAGMTDLGLVADAGGDKLERWRDRFRSVAKDVNQSAGDLRNGAGLMIGRGMDADKAVESIERIGKATTATKASLEDMANLGFVVTDNLRVPVGELGKAFDIMAKAGDLGGFELKHMAQHFPMLTGSVRSLGMEGNKTIGSLSAALQVAMKGAGSQAEAANNLQNFLKAMTSQETVKNFKKMRIDLKDELVEAVRQGKDPMEAMILKIGEAIGADLEKEMADSIKDGMAKGLSQNQALEQATAALEQKFKLSELFQDMQVQNFLAPMLANFKEFRRIREEALKANGTVDSKFATRMQDHEQAVKTLGIAWDSLGESVGRSLLPILTPLTVGLGTLMGGAAGLAEEFPTLTAGVIGAGGAFLVLRTGIAAAQYGTLLLTGGLPAVIGRLTGLGAAATAASAAQKGFGMASLWAGARVAGAGLVSALGAIGSTMLGFARTAVPVVLAGLRALTVGMMTNPVGAVIGGLVLAGGLLMANWETVGPFFGQLWDGIGSAFSVGLSGIQTAIEGAWEGLKTLMAWSPIGLVASNWSGIVDWMSGLWGNVTGIVGSAIDWIGSKLAFIGQAMAAFGVRIDQPQPSAQPAFSNGKAASPRSTRDLMGEAEAGGPRSIRDLLGASESASSAPQSVTYNVYPVVNVQAPPGADPEALGDLIQRKLDDMMRRVQAAHRGALHDGV